MVASLARPGGNATGFVVFEYALATKWLELLKEIAPNVKRAAVLRCIATLAAVNWPRFLPHHPGGRIDRA